MAFGVTSAGYNTKRLADIKTEIEDALKATFGSDINLDARGPWGQLVGIFAERESLIWELAEQVYSSQYPDTAEGVALDNVSAISGVTRLTAIKSLQSNLHLFGTVGTLVPAGTQFSVGGNQTSKFESLTPVTLVAGQNDIQQINFSAVPAAGTWTITLDSETTATIQFNDVAATIEAALNALPFLSGVTVSGDYSIGFTVEFSGDDGLIDWATVSVTTSGLVDGGAAAVITSVAESQTGTPQGLVQAQALEAGPITAPANTLETIETPVTGLDSLRNLEDANVGRNTETDLELRQRRAQTLQLAGAGTVEAIRAALLNLTGVTDAILFENTSLVPNIEGVPPKAFEAVVNGGADQEIYDKIWETKPAGILSHGTEVGSVTDSQGATQEVKFSRPTNLDIFFSLDITGDNNLPANAAQLVEDVVIQMGNLLGIGQDVIIIPTLICWLQDIPGIVDVTVRIETSAVITTPGSPAVDNNITVAANEISDWDSTRGNVNIL